MPFSLIPHQVFDRYGDITVEYLREQNITLLLSDLDFTLAAKSTRRPDQTLRATPCLRYMRLAKLLSASLSAHRLEGSLQPVQNLLPRRYSSAHRFHHLVDL